MQLPKITADDLFTTQAERDSVNQEKVVEIQLKSCDPARKKLH